MTTSLAEALHHLARAEELNILGASISRMQTELAKADLALMRAKVEAFQADVGGRALTAAISAEAEIVQVNAVLHEHGYDYPHGAAGVDSALSSLRAHFDAMRDRVKAALALCDETITRYGDLPEAKLAARFRVTLTEDQ